MEIIFVIIKGLSILSWGMIVVCAFAAAASGSRGLIKCAALFVLATFMCGALLFPKMNNSEWNGPESFWGMFFFVLGVVFIFRIFWIVGRVMTTEVGEDGDEWVS